MTPLLSLVILTIVAYISSKITQSVKTDNVWIKSIAFSGSMYLVLGFILGPGGLNYIDDNVAEQLQVLLALVLTWAGFLVGLQTNYKALRRFPRAYYRTATINFILTLIISFLLIILITWAVKTQFVFYTTELMVIAVTGSVTSPIMLGVVIRDFPVKSAIAHILQFIAAYDNILGIIILGLICAANNNVGFLNDLHPGFELILIPIAISFLAAFFFSQLVRKMKTEQEMFLLVIGFLVYIAGISFYLNQSLLFAGFIFGASISNLGVDDKKVKLAIHDVEKPFYIILLIFMGVNIHQLKAVYLLFLIVFIIIHLLANLSAGYLSLYKFNSHYQRHTQKSVGMANAGMGGISIAIILDYHLLLPTEFTEILIFIIAAAVIINDFLALNYLQKNIVRETKLKRTSTK